MQVQPLAHQTKNAGQKDVDLRLIAFFSSNFTGSSEAQIRHIISELQLDKKIKALEHNLNSFTRVAGVGGVEETVTVVKQIPR